MTPWRASALAGTTLLVSGAVASPAAALPTMVRLGYADCAACHISPQGGGPLNEYGRGIDRAQSLRGGEYVPSSDPLATALTLGGRITQDLRLVLQRQDTWAAGAQSSAFRPRLVYRNVTVLNQSFRVSGTMTAESEHAARPARAYEAAADPSSMFVNTALLHYRAGALEIAAGRDQLPSGVNLPDLSLLVRSRNRLGYYDAPTQVKLFWNGKRFHATPFYFQDTGNEPAGDRERGGGGLAEVDLLGTQRTVVGVSLLQGRALNGERRMVGAYTRLGFGRWGILAEHDTTSRTRSQTPQASFDQSATYAQLFWAIREWLVASAMGERLRVEHPFTERLGAGRLELTARLASQATIGLNVRVQRDAVTGRVTRSVGVQGAFKTVH